MAAIDNMTRPEMMQYILAGISKIEDAGYLKTGMELRDEYRELNGSSVALTEMSYDVEDLLRQLDNVPPR